MSCIYTISSLIHIHVSIYIISYIYIHTLQSYIVYMYTRACTCMYTSNMICQMAYGEAQPVPWLHHNGRTRDHVIVHSGHKTSGGLHTAKRFASLAGWWALRTSGSNFSGKIFEFPRILPPKLQESLLEPRIPKLLRWNLSPSSPVLSSSLANASPVLLVTCLLIFIRTISMYHQFYGLLALTIPPNIKQSQKKTWGLVLDPFIWGPKNTRIFHEGLDESTIERPKIFRNLHGDRTMGRSLGAMMTQSTPEGRSWYFSMWPNDPILIP